MNIKESGKSFTLLKLLIVLAVAVPQVTWAANTNLESVEDRVRNYFKDSPVMIEIARCESKFQHYGSDGRTLRGGWLGGMVGVFQLFERVHINGAKALGFDINTLEGNLGYAKHLYTTSGTKPWNSSKACWENAATTVTATSQAIKSDESVEKIRAELIKQIITLLKILEDRQKIALNQ